MAFILVAVVLSLATVPLITRLTVDASFVALLPTDAQSVRDLEQARQRMRSTSTLTIAIESPSGDVAGMRRFREAIIARLNALPNDQVGTLDSGVSPYRDFVHEYASLFVPLDDLTQLRQALEEKLDDARSRANPFYVDLGADEEDPSAALDAIIDRIRGRATHQDERFPDGMYLHPNHKLLALFSRLGASDASPTSVVNRVRHELHELSPGNYGRDLSVKLAGDVIVAQEEKEAVASELGLALLITLAGVALVVLAFFRRVRAIVLLGLGLLPGTLLSFAIASYTVPQLNLTTAFLGSVLLGNGVNPSVIWLARYFEERRAGHGIEDALERTHLSVWAATLVASGAAAAAYASLIVTDFRGFHDFGIIGGIGMVLCWISAVTFLPAGAALMDRLRPLELPATARLFADGFVPLLRRWPGRIVIVSGLVTLGAVIILGRVVASDPMEYDFRQLRSVRTPNASDTRRINASVNEILDSTTQGRGVAMLARNADDIPVLEAQLTAGRGPDYGAYRSITNLLPRDVPAKLPLLADIRGMMLELRPHASEEEQAWIDEYLPPAHQTPPRIEDIPAGAVHMFTERDGRRGLVLLVDESEEGSLWDGRYLIRWTRALRRIHFTDGERPLLVGQAPIFADMIDAVYADMPKAVLVALFMTMLLAWFGFRRKVTKAAALVSLFLGVAWMATTMAAFGMKLHFLNFIAFPITFGNGVDYPVNVLRRYENEQAEGHDVETSMLTSVQNSGGAVLLCSLTTIIGYASLYASANLAINSFGLAMSISEVTCVLSALVTVPCFLIWRARRSQG